MVVTVPGIRARLGDPKRPEIPLTYPSTSAANRVLPSRALMRGAMANPFCVAAVPTGPRKQLSGYDDE